LKLIIKVPRGQANCRRLCLLKRVTSKRIALQRNSNSRAHRENQILDEDFERKKGLQ